MATLNQSSTTIFTFADDSGSMAYDIEFVFETLLPTLDFHLKDIESGSFLGKFGSYKDPNPIFFAGPGEFSQLLKTAEIIETKGSVEPGFLIPGLVELKINQLESEASEASSNNCYSTVIANPSPS